MEHLNTGNNSFLFLFGKTNDFNFVAGMDLATFYTAGNNGTTTGDGEDVFDRHKERKVCFTFRSGDVAVNSVHKICDAFVNRVVDIVGGIFKNLERRTSDYRDVITGIVILGKEFTNFHFNEFEHFFVAAELVNFVEEYYDVGNTYLTGKKDVLTGLGHRTICCGNNEDGTVHLCCTGDHVFDIVSMSGAVNVCIVTVVGFIFNVCGVDRDTTSFFFRSFIDSVVCVILCLTFKRKVFGDSCSGSGFTMVDVADGTNVYMGFGSLKMLFCHFGLSSLQLVNFRFLF